MEPMLPAWECESWGPELRKSLLCFFLCSCFTLFLERLGVLLQPPCPPLPTCVWDSRLSPVQVAASWTLPPSAGGPGGVLSVAAWSPPVPETPETSEQGALRSSSSSGPLWGCGCPLLPALLLMLKPGVLGLRSGGGQGLAVCGPRNPE